MTLITQPIFLLIFVPLFGVLVILFINNDNFKSVQQVIPNFKTKNFDSFLYNIALFFSLFNLLISIIM